METASHKIRIAAALFAAALCIGADKADAQDNPYGFYTDPAKFTLYPCPALQARAREVADRQRELEELIAKAGNDAGGRMITTLAYRNEYMSVRGEMIEIQKAAAHKSCPPISTAPSPKQSAVPAPRSPIKPGARPSTAPSTGSAVR